MKPTIEPTAHSKSLSELITNAEAGDPNSQYELAQLHDLGQEIPRNLIQAVHWYQRAADQGIMLAALQLGVNPSIKEIKTTKSAGQVTKIYGPPGTGKTTTLIDLVTKAIELGTLPDQIGYFSYTNQATEEAKKRILREFPAYDEVKDFPYFQTLHSLAYRSLRTKVKLLTEEQALDFDKDIVIDRPLMREGDESSRVVRVKHPILDAASTARAIKIPLKEYLQHLPSSQRWPLNKWLGLKFSQWTSNFSETGILKILDYQDRFESYKKSFGAIDYADMLERSIEQSAGLPDFDLLIVDEAQDLTPVQWDLVKILISRSKRTYIAGDDDQAICEPFGARASEFVRLPSNQIDWPLEQSRRVPPAIHSCLAPLVERLNSRFPYRKNKTWKPKSNGPEGSLLYLDGPISLLEEVERLIHAPVKKSILVMAPTNATLKKFSDMLRHKLISHYVSNELVGEESPKIKLQTIWGAKGGESDIAVLLQGSDTDIKMLEEDPRLEYVAVTRAMEKFYYVGFPRSVTESTVNIPEVEAVSTVPVASAPLVISTESRIELKRKFRRAPRP
jgi:superfamily I DNA/RNA helicase